MKNNVCIIGFNYSYNVLLKSFLISRKFNIIGIAGKTKRKKIRNLSIKYFTSWKKMILQLKPDIVAIGVPPKEQEKILFFLLKKKINFLCEKPISKNNKILSYLKTLDKNNKSIKLIDLNFITIPAIQQFKKLISKKKINKNSKIEIDWYFKPKSLKKNSTWKNKKNQLGDEINNFFFHLVSVIEFLFGDFKIRLDHEKNKFYNFFFKNKKTSFSVNFWSRSNKNLFKISLKQKDHSISLINRSKDYHNNYFIFKNGNKIYSKNFKKNKSRIMASKNVIDIFLGKNKNLKKFLELKNGLNIQKKLNEL